MGTKKACVDRMAEKEMIFFRFLSLLSNPLQPVYVLS